MPLSKRKVLAEACTGRLHHCAFHREKVTENAPRHFQGSLQHCFEYVPYTALTIVLIIKTINVGLN